MKTVTDFLHDHLVDIIMLFFVGIAVGMVAMLELICNK